MLKARASFIRTLTLIVVPEQICNFRNTICYKLTSRCITYHVAQKSGETTCRILAEIKGNPCLRISTSNVNNYNPFLDNNKKVGDIRLTYQHALFIIRVYEAIVVV